MAKASRSDETVRAELAQTLDRMAAGQDAVNENPRPRFDPQVARDHVDHWTHGRKIENYLQVLEKCGFVRIPAEQLPPWWGETGPQLRTDGEWRNLAMARRLPDMRMAFTDDDITSKFLTPEDFWHFYQEAYQQKRAAAAGLVLPPRGIVASS